MMNEVEFTEIRDKLTQELRRGILVLATLSQLDEQRYGYSLIDRLASQGLDIEQGTLYPLLRRLEGQGLLESEWNVDGSRPRRYYVISPDGRQVLAALAAEWRQIVKTIDRVLANANDMGVNDESI